MKLKTNCIISIFIIIIIISSSFKVSAILPKSISQDIWVDGEFEGKIDCQFYDGTKCVLMDRKVARSVLRHLQKKSLSQEDKLHVASFMLKLEGLTHGSEG